AIERHPNSEASIRARPQIFHALRQMVESSQSQWFDDGASDPSKPDAKPRVVFQREELGPTPLIQDLALLDALCARMGIAASTTDHRVSYLMALGRLREAQRDHVSSVEAYQRILEDATLAPSTWYGPELAVRADLEATRRLEALVRREGAECYRVYDGLASAETSLGTDRGASGWEDLAKRYPVASSAPIAWLEAARAHDDAGEPTMAIRALRAGLHAAEVSARSGRDASSLGLLAGALYDALRDRGLDGQALRHLVAMRESWPGLALTTPGGVLDRDRAIRDLERRYAQRHRRASIGPRLGSETQSLPGWSILEPLEEEGRSTSHILLLNPGRSEVACFTGEPLEAVWSRPYASSRPEVYRLDEHAAWLVWRTSEGASIERIDVATGETVWKTEPFRTMFPADDPFARQLRDALGAPRQMESPIDGVVDVTSILLTSDDETLAIVERSGRACAIDARSGEVIWHLLTPIRQVHDVDARGGMLVIGGAVEASPPSRPSLIAYDLRTGEAMHRMHDLQSQVRWVRLAPGGDLIAGFDHGITSVQLLSGRVNWTLTDEAGILTRNAWMHGDHLFLLDGRQDVWLASVSTGR
ncbi:MAG: PQQ-binding-like beta-propeller repeat protein, partial [Phycisphaerales bacterium]|nr:PQQ-binding-like beta-propeller repeat protein [Phycisphaerales bacterium]